MGIKVKIVFYTLLLVVNGYNYNCVGFNCFLFGHCNL